MNLLTATTRRLAAPASPARVADQRRWTSGFFKHSLGIPAGLLVLAAACFTFAPAHAGGLPGDANLLFDCKAAHLPSQQDIERLLGIHSFHQTYVARARLMQTIRRECLRGAAQVMVKADDSSSSGVPVDLAQTQ